MWGSAGTAPLLATLSLDGVVTFMPCPHYLGKKLYYPLNKSGWVPELVWKLRKREKSLAPARNRKKDSSVIQPVA
jgi:hypothetical protein